MTTVKLILSISLLLLLTNLNLATFAQGNSGKHFGFGKLFKHNNGSARSQEQHFTNFFHPTGKARANSEHIDNSLFKGAYHGKKKWP